jgi:hypothetical protein
MSENSNSMQKTSRQYSQVTKEQLEHDFFVLGLNQKQVAAKYSCDIGTLRSRMKKLGIILETKLKSHSLSKEDLEYDFFILGLNQKQVTVKHNISIDVLRDRIKRFNINLEVNIHNHSFTKEQLKYDLFIEPMFLGDIAKKYDCDIGTINRRIDLWGFSKYTYDKSPQVRQLLYNKLELTQRQRSIIIGSILGDGSICKKGHISVRNTYLQYFQCKERKEYLFWKAIELQPFVRDIYQIKCGTYFMDTVSYTIFNEFYDLFWIGGKGGRKIVPNNIEDYLDELALAVWFQDDGYLGECHSIISTQGFSLKDNGTLVQAIENKFSISPVIRWQKISTMYLPYLRFPAIEHRKLHKIIDPLLHTCFEYKKLPKNRASETNMQSSSIIEDEDIVTDLYSDV